MHREPLAGAERKPFVVLCQTWESNIQGNYSVATAGKIILKRMDVRNSKAWMFASQHGNCYFFQFCIPPRSTGK